MSKNGLFKGTYLIGNIPVSSNPIGTYYHDVHLTLIHNGSGMVIPAFTNINDGIADNIMGMPSVPLGQLSASEWPEFIWLA